jgi:hypothetical protein
MLQTNAFQTLTCKSIIQALDKKCRFWDGAQWHISVILHFESLRQEDLAFKANLVYIAGPCLGRENNVGSDAES